MPICQVAIATPLYKSFDYLAPKSVQDANSLLGCRVKVSFGRRQAIGIVTNITDTSDFPIEKLKTISDILDIKPALPTELLELGIWLSDYYHQPIGEVLLGMLPSKLRQGLPPPYDVVWKLTDDATKLTLSDLSRAKKQQALLQLFHDHPEGLSDALFKAQSPAIKKVFKDKHWVQAHALHYEEQLAPAVCNPSPFELNPEQNAAIDKIITESNNFKAILLDGVTGSGKTEVYLQVIANTLKQGKQALVLVPEIGLTPQTVARFQKRFDTKIAIIHSNLTDNERLNAWQQAYLGQARIIIGTRSAIFTPFYKLGLIIIDEEHDLSFKQQEGFRYSARDIATMRARKNNVPIVMGSATPSLESFYNAKQGRFQTLRLTQRAGIATQPLYNVIDMRKHDSADGLCQPTINLITEHLNKGNQVLLFLNRRGYAPSLLCHRCGWIANCPQCDSRLTLHTHPHYLRCHHCDYSEPQPKRCKKCDTNNFVPVGLGTERIEFALSEKFPQYNIVRIDRDTTSRKGKLEGYLEDINSGKSQILIGTQMLAKGHHFPNVTLVVMLNADSALMSSDFRGTERFGQLLMQVTGRSGRAEKSGEVIIQTHNPEHPALMCLLDRGYQAFSEMILSEREQTDFPPINFHALLHAQATQQELSLSFLNSFAKKYDFKDVEVLGPIPALMERKAGFYRAQLLLQSSKRSALHFAVKTLIDEIHKKKPDKKIRWNIDIDPIEMV